MLYARASYVGHIFSPDYLGGGGLSAPSSWNDYFLGRGYKYPSLPQPSTAHFPPLFAPFFDLGKLAPLSIPPMILLYFEGKVIGYLDLYFYQSISPLSDGNIVDLDLGVLWEFPPLFFLSYISITLVALVGFEGEGPEHLCSCHCIGCIDLSSP
jgi:hypothetical protein